MSDADVLIESLEKLITKKRHLKQGAMRELLRPNDGWEVKKLSEHRTRCLSSTNRQSNLVRRKLLDLVGLVSLMSRGRGCTFTRLLSGSQYFGVKAAQQYARNRKGGIIWHTQCFR